MSVKVQDNTSQILTDARRNSNLALRLMTEAIHQEAQPHTPKKEGFLSRDVLKQVLGLKAKIVWNKTYAVPQEAGVVRGRKIRNYSTPGTGPHFAENAIVKINDRASQFFKKARLI